EFRENYIKMGLRITYYRKLKNMSQEELAEKAGLSASFIGQIEAPNTYKSFSFDTLFLIAQALDVPPCKLLDFD
ncbi:MAG: helix-turn-helix transcriptional regulator, partial [Firmicutes bacterium]|nr:helix-turn-helix transcriptional regulator [Bacillota bacterium]